MSINFLLTALIVAAAPGTGVLFVMSTGLSAGRSASVAAAFGCMLGIAPHLAAAMLGITAVLHASVIAFTAIKIAGIAYLLFMARQALRRAAALPVSAVAASHSKASILRSGIVVSLLNPKMYVFFLALLPPFVAPDDGGMTLRIAERGGLFMVMVLVIFIGYGCAAAQMRSFVSRRRRATTWINRFFAAGFVAISIKLALADR
ncbi:MAG: LysE family translocator [Azospirillaceae bacterium]|nr:LysE family translocator [Azospirillaceae bacterium]